MAIATKIQDTTTIITPIINRIIEITIIITAAINGKAATKIIEILQIKGIITLQQAIIIGP
jgi:hypothetical protein